VVVGPKELPGLVRTVSGWMRQARRVAGEFKEELSREVARAEELKQLIEKETEIAEVHRALEEARSTITIGGEDAGKNRAGEAAPADGKAAAGGDVGSAAQVKVRDGGRDA
jgi:sec-independent protein translocase protein TatB